MKKIIEMLLKWKITQPIMEKICELIMGEDLEDM